MAMNDEYKTLAVIDLLQCIIVFILMYKSSMKILYHSGCMQSYGEDCQYPCSKHCVNETCDRFNGNCQFGCVRGYHGQKCEQGTYI